MSPATASPLPCLSAVLLAVVATACYGAAPPRPTTIPLPPLVEGAQIVVESEQETTLENVAKKSVACPQGHIEGSPACVITRYSVREPVTRTRTTATYGGTPINFAQFRILTDPEHDTKLARLDRASRACRGANVPRWIGTGLVLGGLVAWGLAGATEQAAFTYAGAVALAGGVGSYAYGYLGHGGNQCKDAVALHRELEMAGDAKVTTVPGSGWASEMKVLADRFNASSVTTRASQP